MPNASGGYQPDTKSPSARRADFDLLRRNTALQRQAEGLQAELDAAEARLTALETPDPPVPWIPLAKAGGWVSEGAPLAPAAYRKIGDMVYLQGTAQYVGNFTPGTVATLPVGYMPPNMLRISVGAHKAGVGGFWLIRGAIFSDGRITADQYSATDIASPVFYFSDIPPFSITP